MDQRPDAEESQFDKDLDEHHLRKMSFFHEEEEELSIFPHESSNSSASFSGVDAIAHGRGVDIEKKGGNEASPFYFEHHGVGDNPEMISQLQVANFSNPDGSMRLLSHRSRKAAVNQFQIVLYGNRNIVVYNPYTQILAARSFNEAELGTIATKKIARCPMCHQAVDPLNFTFEAQAYFAILQQWVLSQHAGGFRAKPGRSNESLPAFNSEHDMMKKVAMKLTAVNTTPGHWSFPSSNDFGALTGRSSKTQHLHSDADFEASDSGQEEVEEYKGYGDTRYKASLSGGSMRQKVDNPFIAGNLEDDASDVHTSVTGTQSQLKSIPRELLVTGYYNQFFQEKKLLGSGSYGKVYLCIHLIDKITLGEYAVKKIPVGDDKIWFRKMINEVKIREKLHHTNIVDYKHSWLEMHRANELCPLVPWLFVLMEFCNAGNLENLVWDRGIGNEPSRYLSDDEIWKVLLDIIFGLQHLHHSGILYRDLKTSNVLLNYSYNQITGKMSSNVLLSDFGTAELMNDSLTRSTRQGYTGTVEYTAPELLEIDEKGGFRDDYDAKSDMWSLGIIIYALCYAGVPYSDENPSKCRDLILSHESLYLPDFPPRDIALRQLMLALTSQNPSERPTTDDILGHEIVKNILNDDQYLELISETLASEMRQKTESLTQC